MPLLCTSRLLFIRRLIHNYIKRRCWYYFTVTISLVSANAIYGLQQNTTLNADSSERWQYKLLKLFAECCETEHCDPRASRDVCSYTFPRFTLKLWQCNFYTLSIRRGYITLLAAAPVAVAIAVAAAVTVAVAVVVTLLAADLQSG